MIEFAEEANEDRVGVALDTHPERLYKLRVLVHSLLPPYRFESVERTLPGAGRQSSLSLRRDRIRSAAS
jgi:hypothetical protein